MKCTTYVRAQFDRNKTLPIQRSGPLFATGRDALGGQPQPTSDRLVQRARRV